MGSQVTFMHKKSLTARTGTAFLARSADAARTGANGGGMALEEA